MASGALDPVAEGVFSLPYDSFLVEWDDMERDGNYSALRYVPKGNGPVVGLGVISTKLHDLESEEWVLAQIEEASDYLDIGQPALAPHCGFGTVPGMESATEELQWRKLARGRRPDSATERKHASDRIARAVRQLSRPISP